MALSKARRALLVLATTGAINQITNPSPGTAMSNSIDSPPTSNSHQCPTIPPLLQRYFDALNAHNFQQAANMYATDGQLVPPFEEPITGRSAIEAHLTDEASDMTFILESCDSISADDDTSVFLVKGKVSTPLLKVGVAWTIGIDKTNQIASVEIKLLATLRELLRLRQS